MYRKLLTIIWAAFALCAKAQQQNAQKPSVMIENRTSQNATKQLPANNKAADSVTFKGNLYNKEYNVYLRIDFYRKQIRVPGQDIFGDLPGFFGDYEDGRKWLFTDAVLVNPRCAKLQIVNDYGSEDLEATLTYEKDGSFTLTQESGSTIKIARNRKWVKMPKKLVFVRR